MAIQDLDFKIAAILKFSTLDYPGKLSVVVFTQGCPIRCVYCHNPDFQNYDAPGKIGLDELQGFLKTRKGLLDAVVFSGGDPLMQKHLPDAISMVKDEGFLAGLHTAGTIPSMFKKVLPLLDWVGFDVKTAINRYESITQVSNSGALAEESVDMLLESNTSFEIRTTVDSRTITSEDLIQVAKFLQNKNIKTWVIQECIIRSPQKDLKIPLPEQGILSELEKYVHIEIRRQ